MKQYKKETYLAWLASAGLAPEHARELLEKEPDPSVIFERFHHGDDIFPDRKIPDRLSSTMRNNAGDRAMDFWQRLIEQYNIHAITIADDIFPSRLRPLPDAPAILFYQGDLSALKRSAVSVVGSRRASLKGQEATRKITEKLSRNEIAVISGLAYGIDAAAHHGCLKGGSPTIAVLGCGLEQDYPQEHAKLRRDILDHGGLILSEYAPGEKPLGWHFPYRNRIVSGLGDCLVLMEAQIRSGSMTSVQHALNQGKDVFVYPGDPDSVKFEGNHQLLREGAIYFTRAEDLMEDMGWLDKMRNVGQNSESSADHSLPKVSASEAQVLKILSEDEKSFDQLCEALSMPAAQLNAVLSMLQIQGLIQALPGKVYHAI